MDYPEIDQHGELVCIRAGSNYTMMLQSVGDGNSLLIEMPPDVPSWWDDQALAWVAKPAQPSPWHRWDRVAKVWTDPRSATALKADRWVGIKSARAAAEVAPLTVDGRTYDADPESQRRISGAVQLALIAALSVHVASATPGEPPTQAERLAALDAAGWSIDWTLANNAVATLTAAEVIAVGIALGAHVSAAHAAARLLRARIESAEDAPEINAITWPAP